MVWKENKSELQWIKEFLKDDNYYKHILAQNIFHPLRPAIMSAMHTPASNPMYN